ncbi:hypothetical protein L1049_010005 [Liquidambar formosana]|uniref:Pentatricopeptide repeat-containing protein n=1 Tax=Liquidambar formosana TaxID=63359 RepID=A0AAP0N8H3_LIQFO
MTDYLEAESQDEGPSRRVKPTQVERSDGDRVKWLTVSVLHPLLSTMTANLSSTLSPLKENSDQELPLLLQAQLPLTSIEDLSSNHSSLFTRTNSATIPNPNLPESPNSQYPDGKTTSSSKSYIWVNPRSPRASRLRQHSYDARYASLVKVAESLNSCNPSYEDVSSVLIGLGDNILEQDVLIVLNNMSNPETALLAIKFFQLKLKASREVIPYNVTFKVFRKCRNFGGAENLFDEMLEKGVKPDNVTFSTLKNICGLCFFQLGLK